MRLVSVQILRGIAALLVVALHSWVSLYPDIPQGRAAFGNFGVDLFFVISGFIMAHIMGRYSGKPGDFLARRYLRVAPLAYLMLLISLVTYWVRHVPFDPMGVISAVTFLPVFGHYVVPSFTVLWTLSFEAVLYVLVFVVILCRGNQKHLLILLLWLATAGSIYTPQTDILRWLTNPLLFEFALGVLAYLYRPPRPVVLVGLGIAIVIMVTQFVTDWRINPHIDIMLSGGSLPRAVTWGLPAFLIMNAVLVWKPSGPLVPFAQKLGDASYSIYLTHLLIILPLVVFLPANPVSWFALIVLAALFGLLFYRRVERPLNDLHRDVSVRKAKGGPIDPVFRGEGV